MSRTLKRPMFRRGGSTNDGIMSGLTDRKQFQNDPLKNFNVENIGESTRDYIEQFEPILREYTPKTRLPIGAIGAALVEGTPIKQALTSGYVDFTKRDDAREAAIRKGAAQLGISQAISQEQNRLKQLLKDPRIDLERKVDFIKRTIPRIKTDEDALEYINRSVGDVSKQSFENRVLKKIALSNNPNSATARPKAIYQVALEPNIPIEKTGSFINVRNSKFPKTSTKGLTHFDLGSGKLYEFQGGDANDINNYLDVTEKYNINNFQF